MATFRVSPIHAFPLGPCSTLSPALTTISVANYCEQVKLTLSTTFINLDFRQNVLQRLGPAHEGPTPSMMWTACVQLGGSPRITKLFARMCQQNFSIQSGMPSCRISQLLKGVLLIPTTPCQLYCKLTFGPKRLRSAMAARHQPGICR